MTGVGLWWWVLVWCSVELLVLLPHGVSAARIGVAAFTQPRGMTKDSVLRYKGPDLPSMSEMTLCLRVRVLQPRQFATLLSYSEPDYDNEFTVGLKLGTMELECCRSLIWRSFPLPFQLFEWFSVCVSLHLRQGNVTVVMDGRVLFHETNGWENTESVEMIGGGILVLGQEQDNYGGLFDKFESFKGSIADLHWFNKSLNTETLIGWSKNFTEISLPAVVSFQSFDNFIVGEVDLNFETNLEIFSQTVVPLFKVFTVSLSYAESFFLCNATGGSLPNVYSQDENRELFTFVASREGVCNIENPIFDIVWLNHVIDKNGIVRDHPNGRESNFSYFLTTPKVEAQDLNCIAFYGCDMKSPLWHESWSPIKCGIQRLPLCTYQKFPFLRLRGLCPSTRFDQKFFIDEESVNPGLTGMFLSKIDRINSNNSNSFHFFKLYNVAGLHAEAHLNLSITYPLPIGRHEWTIIADNCETGKVTLVVTSCNESQFTCNDGSCINRIKRCDSVIHCSDGSDERNCVILRVPPVGYYPKLPPPERVGKKLKIESLVSISRIFGFDLHESTLKCDLVVTMSWRDSAISFANLKPNPNENTIDEDSFNLLWIPEYELYDDDFSVSEKITRSKTLHVERISKPEADDPSSLIFEYIYKGQNNPLVLKHIITVTSTCKLQLSQFPFDVQQCIMYIALRRLDGYTVLEPKNGTNLVNYSGITLSKHYFVKNYSASIELVQNADAELVRVIKLILVFQNRFIFYLVNIYVPSLIMLVIGYLSFFFPLHDFSNRIMVSLTALLVETTIFTQVSDYAPRTSFLKKIDVWCILCIALLFGIIVAVTIINIFMEKIGVGQPGNVYPGLETKYRKEELAHMTPTYPQRTRTVQVRPRSDVEGEDLDGKPPVVPPTQDFLATFPASLPSSNYLEMKSFTGLKNSEPKNHKNHSAFKINRYCLFLFPATKSLFLALYAWQIISHEDFAFII